MVKFGVIYDEKNISTVGNMYNIFVYKNMKGVGQMKIVTIAVKHRNVLFSYISIPILK